MQSKGVRGVGTSGESGLRAGLQILKLSGRVERRPCGGKRALAARISLALECKAAQRSKGVWQPIYPRYRRLQAKSFAQRNKILISSPDSTLRMPILYD